MAGNPLCHGLRPDGFPLQSNVSGFRGCQQAAKRVQRVQCLERWMNQACAVAGEIGNIATGRLSDLADGKPRVTQNDKPRMALARFELLQASQLASQAAYVFLVA